MKRRQGAIILAVLAASSSGRAAAGDPAAYPVEIVAAIPPASAAGAAGTVLLGRSGQLYQSVAPGQWKRVVGGGVAVDLAAAVRSGSRPGTSEDLLAIGAESPPFRFQNGAWHAEALSNRGPMTLTATGPVPVLAVGRHIYTLDTGVWVRRTSAPVRVTAAWAEGPKALLVATSDGALVRWNGRRFTPVRTQLAAGDPIVCLVGDSASALYARGQSGTWIRVDRGGTAALQLDSELTGFEEHTYGLGPDGRLWLGGTVLAPDGSRRATLIRADKNRVVAAADLPPLEAGDRLAVVMGFSATGEVLVATRAGAVRVRSKTGTWTEGRASGALPPRPALAGRPSGPARTR